MSTQRNAALKDLKARVDALYLEYVFPVLATLRLGEEPAAVALETELLEAAGAAGIKLRRYIMPADLSGEDVSRLIREINADFLISALLLEPLPPHLDEAALRAEIAPRKDLSAPIPAGEDPVLCLLRRTADAAERSAR